MNGPTTFIREPRIPDRLLRTTTLCLPNGRHGWFAAVALKCPIAKIEACQNPRRASCISRINPKASMVRPGSGGLRSRSRDDRSITMAGYFNHSTEAGSKRITSMSKQATNSGFLAHARTAQIVCTEARCLLKLIPRLSGNIGETFEDKADQASPLGRIRSACMRMKIPKSSHDHPPFFPAWPLAPAGPCPQLSRA